MKLTELIETAQLKGQRYILEHHQCPAAVLLGYEDFENLMEIIAEQNDREFQESLRQSMAEAKAGKGYTKDEEKPSFELVFTPTFTRDLLMY
ncbi:TPA: type II toxin-antitoxin system Phd/YefM family antitoxin [Candidatus Poribacteria bacterium]|nr:type II toxin-antitoxin system Phd/YefM family antitoxin [Candidatus Poribacteria bacterium]